jgi:hypothetical protein
MNYLDGLGVRTWCRYYPLSLLRRVHRLRGIVALAAVLCVVPCGRAQHEVSPDHFTEDGVEGVWPVRVAASKQVAHAVSGGEVNRPKTKRVAFRNASRKTAAKPGN